MVRNEYRHRGAQKSGGGTCCSEYTARTAPKAYETDHLDSGLAPSVAGNFSKCSRAHASGCRRDRVLRGGVAKEPDLCGGFPGRQGICEGRACGYAGARFLSSLERLKGGNRKHQRWGELGAGDTPSGRGGGLNLS